jgi:hypothetical protein
MKAPWFIRSLIVIGPVIALTHLSTFAGTAHVTQDFLALKDNTIYAESETLSNAKGQRFFSGNNSGGIDTNPDPRRGLIAFAIADSIPAGWA